MAGIYIHIPFCKSKCYYCDFYSITDLSFIESFNSSLIKEIELYSNKYDLKNYQINSIYFGGGTPTILTYHYLNKILDSINKYFSLEKGIEITIETNPNTINEELAIILREMGFNRISIGVQSFNDNELKFLKRIHNSLEAKTSLKMITSFFHNVNIDLIYGIPNQTIDSWIKTLEITLDYEPKHLSIYNLIYEEETQLYKDYNAGKFELKSDEEDENMYLTACEILEKSRYEHYEISNFAKSGFRCGHNLGYWNGKEYFGFGPSASGYIEKNRYTNIRDINKYIKYISNNKLPIEFTEVIDKEKKMVEYIMLGLRSFGINLVEFKNNFGYDLMNDNLKIFEEMEKNKMLKILNGTLKLTDRGYFVCNSICLAILKKLRLKFI